MRGILIAGLVAGCRPIPPPPMIASHASTAPDPRGTATVMLVFGAAGQLFGGGGYGLALRGEYQETDHTTFGLELGGGRGDQGRRPDQAIFRHYLVALRGYGRYSPGDHDWFAVTYGAGLSIMRTGMVTGTLHGGVGVGYPNDFVVPTLNTGLTLAVPFIAGDHYSSSFSSPNFGEPLPHPIPAPDPDAAHTRISAYLDAGLIVPIDRARLSLDLGAIVPLNGPSGADVFELSGATGARVRP